MSLLEQRTYYRPFEYDWAFMAYKQQQQMHWLADEIPLDEDVGDWDNKLNISEKNLLTQLFRFFTQTDIDIAGAYIDKYMPMFKPPEVRMMLSSFASMEATHIHAYSLLLDTVGMPESEYKAFQEYEEMSAKHDYLDNVDMGSLEEIAKSLAIYSAFGEGLQLFSSFAMLLNFPRFGKMKGMGQIVSYSFLDEDLHVNSMIQLFHEFIDEHPEIWTSKLKSELYQVCRDMVDLEDKFIDLAYSAGEMEGLASDEVKQYIRFTADKRLLQLGLKPNYGVKTNPLEWIDWMMSGVSHVSFFENKETGYGKASLTGNWGKVWEEVDSNNSK